MSDDREFWRATTDWLEAGSDRTSAAAIDAVLLAVRTTRQDRAIPIPWRPFHVPTLVRVAIVAALVATLALVTSTFVGDHRPVPNPTSNPTPVPTPVASAPVLASNAAPLPIQDSQNGLPLQGGYRSIAADTFPIRMSIVAPPEWSGHIGGPNAVWLGPVKGDDVVSFQRFDKVFTDPCHPEPGALVPAIGPAASDLVDRIVTRPGLAPTTKTVTTVGGLPATLLELRLNGSTTLGDCTNGKYELWELPLGAVNELRPGMSERVWVMDVEGQRLVVLAIDAGGASQAQQQAIQQLLDSIRFEPQN